LADQEREADVSADAGLISVGAFVFAPWVANDLRQLLHE